VPLPGIIPSWTNHMHAHAEYFGKLSTGLSKHESRSTCHPQPQTPMLISQAGRSMSTTHTPFDEFWASGSRQFLTSKSLPWYVMTTRDCSIFFTTNPPGSASPGFATALEPSGSVRIATEL